MTLNPVIVGGSSAEPEETPDLYIELSARIMAATNYIEMRKPDGKAQRLRLGSEIDTRVTYHLFVYQYGTYTFEKDDGKEGGVTTKTVTFEKGGPTTQSVRL